MIVNKNTSTPIPSVEVMQQAGFWLKVVDGWKREINKVVTKSEDVVASAEITAEVARTAGELSVLSEKLDELSSQIIAHKVNLHDAELTLTEHDTTHSLLAERLYRESRKFRDLLSEMFKLNQAAYKRFLC